MNVDFTLEQKTTTRIPSHILLSTSNSTTIQLISSTINSANIDALSPFDQFWVKAQQVGIVDSDGMLFEEVIKKYPLKELNPEEVKLIIDLLKNPTSKSISVNNAELSYTLLEYFNYLIKEASSQFDIEITSINIIGGKLPQLLKPYYIRTINELYKSRCLELNLNHKESLVSEKVALDFDRIAPDTDFISTIKVDLVALLNREGMTHYFAEQLPTKYGSNVSQREAVICDYKKWLLEKNLDGPHDTDIRSHIETMTLALLTNLAMSYFTSKLPAHLGKASERSAIIKNSNFYHDFCKFNGLSLISFGPEDCIVDCSFVYEKNIEKSLFKHHAPRINILSLIKNCVLNGNKLILLGRLQPLLERAGKRLSIAGEVNERALYSYLSNITIGYCPCNSNMGLTFLNKITINILPSLKKTWEKHLSTKPSALIFLAFNFIMLLMEDQKYAGKSREYWIEMMRWLEKEASTNEKDSPFLISLKEILNNQSIPFDACRDILQLYGILSNSSLPQHLASDLKASISYPKVKAHLVCITHNIHGKAYSISMPLDSSRAICTLLKLEAQQLDLLGNLAQHLRPSAAYDKKLIPTEIITDKLADEALKFLDSPHKELKCLGFELLLLHALSEPKPWMLKNFIKYFPAVLESIDTTQHPRLIANLENALKGFPDEIETKKLTSPIIDFCRSSEKNLVGLCYAMALTNDPDLILAAVSFHLDHENIPLHDQLKLIKMLLPLHPAQATKLLVKLQVKNLLTDEEELKIFKEIAEAIKKNRQNQHYQLLPCAEKLFRPEKPHAREVSQLIAQALINVKHPLEAQSWTACFLQSKDLEVQFFNSDQHYSLLSLKLPLQLTEALQILFNLSKEELEIFVQLMEQLPHSPPTDLTLLAPMKALPDLSKKCFKRKESFFQRIGLELLMVYTATVPLVNNSKKSEGTIDPRLKVLVSFLPIVLAAANPSIRDILLNAMKSLLPLSFSQYFTALRSACSQSLNNRQQATPKTKNLKEGPSQKPQVSQEFLFLKTIYQANCNALAATPELYELTKKLVDLGWIHKELSLNFTESDQVEIAFSTIKALLPGRIQVALEILQMLEKENKAYKTLSNQSIFGAEKKEIFTAIIGLLIAQNNLKTAKDQLLKCMNHKIFNIDEIKTTELWLKFWSKALHHPDFGPTAVAELWKTIKMQGGAPKKHSPELQVDLMIDIIQSLDILKTSSSDALTSELITQTESFPFTQLQRSKLSLLIIENLQKSQPVDLLKLKQSYQFLKEPGVSFELLLFWLKAAQEHPESLQEETFKLLTIALKMINNLQSSEDIIAITTYLVKALQDTEQKSGQAYKELRLQVISSHSLLTETLKTSLAIDLFSEYLNVIYQHQLLDKIPENIANQSLWLADEFLKKYLMDLAKLQTLHKLLKKCLYHTDLNTLTIDTDKRSVPNKFATILIKNQLHDEAKDWIDFTIKMQKCALLVDTDITEDLCFWCESFMDTQQLPYCVTLFTAFVNMPSGSPEMQEKLCLKISKVHLNDHPPEVLKIIESTVSFSTQKEFKSDIDKKQALDRRFELIEMIIESSDKNLILCGIALLSNLYHLKEPAKWAKLCDRAIKSWLTTQANGHLTYSQDIKALIHQQNTIIQKISSSERTKFEKNLALCTLRAHSKEDVNEIETSLARHIFNITSCLNDENWLKESSEILAKNLILRTSTINIFSLEFFHISFISSCEKLSIKCLNFYLLKLIKLGLALEFGNREAQAMGLYFTGRSLNKIIQNYMTDNKSKNIFHNQAKAAEQHKLSSEDLEIKENINEIIGLTEKYLLCCFSLDQDWWFKQRFGENLIAIDNKSEAPRPKSLFQDVHKEIVQNLENWGYEHSYPIQALLFQLIINDDANISNYEGEEIPLKEKDEVKNILKTDLVQIDNEPKQTGTEKEYPVFKTLQNVKIVHHFSALNKAIPLLISQNNLRASWKALNLIVAPDNLWKKNFEELTKLFILVIKDKTSYPCHVQSIGRCIIGLTRLFHENEKCIPVLTEICIHFHKMLQNKLILGHSISQNSDYAYALAFIPNYLKSFPFNGQHVEFPQLFEFQLDAFLDCKLADFNHSIINEFINRSLESSLKSNQEPLFNILSRKIKRLLPSNHKELKNNLTLITTLNSNGYFQNRKNQLYGIWDLFISQFPSKGTKFYGNQAELINLIGTQLSILEMLNEDHNAKVKRNRALYKLVYENLDVAIVNNAACCTGNISIASALSRHKFLNNDKFIKIFDMIFSQFESLKKINGNNDFLSTSLCDCFVSLCLLHPAKTLEEKKLLIQQIKSKS